MQRRRSRRARATRHGEQAIEHLLRRAGFGASQEEIDDYSDLGFADAVRRLVNYERSRTMSTADRAARDTC